MSPSQLCFHRKNLFHFHSKWRKFLGLNDGKLTRNAKFLTTDELAKQFSGGRVITRGAAKKRNNDEEEGGEGEEKTLPKRKRRRKRENKNEEEEEASSTATEERNGEKRNGEEEVEKSERGGVEEEEETRDQEERGYKSEQQSSPGQTKSHEKSPSEEAVDQARKKINEAQEKEEETKIQYLPIGSLVSKNKKSKKAWVHHCCKRGGGAVTADFPL